MEAPILNFTLSALVIVFAGTHLTRYTDVTADLTKLGNASLLRQGQRHA